MIWKATGNLHRKADVPSSIKERPLYSCQCCYSNIIEEGLERRNVPFHPVCDDDTEDVESELDGNELSAGGMFGRFSCPDRNNSIQDTGTDAVDKTSYTNLPSARCFNGNLHGTAQLTTDHPGSILGTALQTSAKNGPNASNSNGSSSTNPITNPSTMESAYQGSQVINRNDAALQQTVCDDWRVLRPVDGLRVSKFHHINIMFGIVYATHHTLIIAEEEN